MIPFRNVIVCHIVPGSEQKVGDVFAHYDALTRPQDLGVIGRMICAYDDVYLHIIERKEDPAISGQRRGLPAFQQIAEEIAPYVTPYPSTWANPSDSVAKEFYRYVGDGPEPEDTEVTIILQRMVPGSEAEIARVFEESDASGLPKQLGVVGRWLYSSEDAFVHLLEQDTSIAKSARHDHDGKPEFAELMRKLAPYVSPYRPDRWQGPKDSVATVYYRWQAPDWGTSPEAELTAGSVRPQEAAWPQEAATTSA